MANPEWNPLVGQRIRERRKRWGFSLRKLANKVGVTHAAISYIENGKECPSSHLLFKIGRALDCQMDYFYRPVKDRTRGTET